METARSSRAHRALTMPSSLSLPALVSLASLRALMRILPFWAPSHQLRRTRLFARVRFGIVSVLTRGRRLDFRTSSDRIPCQPHACQRQKFSSCQQRGGCCLACWRLPLCLQDCSSGANQVAQSTASHLVDIEGAICLHSNGKGSAD